MKPLFTLNGQLHDHIRAVDESIVKGNGFEQYRSWTRNICAGGLKQAI